MFTDALLLWHDAAVFFDDAAVLFHDAVVFFDDVRFFHGHDGDFLLFAFLFFDDPAAITLIPGRSKKDAPAVIQNAPMLLTKENSFRTQPPCALFSGDSPFFNVPLSDFNAYARRIDAPSLGFNAQMDYAGRFFNTKHTKTRNRAENR